MRIRLKITPLHWNLIPCWHLNMDYGYERWAAWLCFVVYW